MEAGLLRAQLILRTVKVELPGTVDEAYAGERKGGNNRVGRPGERQDGGDEVKGAALHQSAQTLHRETCTESFLQSVSVDGFGLIDVGFFQHCLQRLAGGSPLLDFGGFCGVFLSCQTSCSCLLLHVYT